jgi:hypothetical protein
MDDAEDGCVGADAEREGTDDDRGEPPCVQERATRRVPDKGRTANTG